MQILLDAGSDQNTCSQIPLMYLHLVYRREEHVKEPNLSHLVQIKYFCEDAWQSSCNMILQRHLQVAE
jgi:hypothetical protein